MGQLSNKDHRKEILITTGHGTTYNTVKKTQSKTNIVKSALKVHE